MEVRMYDSLLLSPSCVAHGAMASRVVAGVWFGGGGGRVAGRAVYLLLVYSCFYYYVESFHWVPRLEGT